MIRMGESKALSASLQPLSTLLAEHPTTGSLADRVQSLRGRLISGRFHLAVLGQFKRGKGTLLNALLGEPVLPTGAVPVTAIPTLIEYSPESQAHIIFNDGTTRLVSPNKLEDYVTEQNNAP